jgi:hypothetical protein
MKHIVESLISISIYLKNRIDEDINYIDDIDDNDLDVLTDVICDLRNASDAELSILAQVAEELYQENLNTGCQPELLEAYGHFMELTFDEGWQGNSKI